jgi:hypothetical protein
MDDIFETQHGNHSDGTARGGGPGGIEYQCLDFCPICRTADVLRAALPDEFSEHWHGLQKEGLLAARAILDHYIQHIESRRPHSVPVEDIPIE